jgi:hypothetical protein
MPRLKPRKAWYANKPIVADPETKKEARLFDVTHPTKRAKVPKHAKPELSRKSGKEWLHANIKIQRHAEKLLKTYQGRRELCVPFVLKSPANDKRRFVRGQYTRKKRKPPIEQFHLESLGDSSLSGEESETSSGGGEVGRLHDGLVLQKGLSKHVSSTGEQASSEVSHLHEGKNQASIRSEEENDSHGAHERCVKITVGLAHCQSRKESVQNFGLQNFAFIPFTDIEETHEMIATHSSRRMGHQPARQMPWDRS